MEEYASDLYRKEAVTHHLESRAEGDVLRILPPWTRWSYRLLIASCVLCLLFAAFFGIYQYASGPAVIQVEGRISLTAKRAGTVAAVEVKPGDHVQAGQRVVLFYEAPEANELSRINREFDLLLVRMLRDPTDQHARQALSALRAERELAEARLTERSVHAPGPGVISDVRIRPGQHLQPGDVVVSLVPEEARFSVVALLPGQYRPFLRKNQSLRLELSGFRYDYRELTIQSIGDEVVGPAEVRRYLPPEIADAVQIKEPVVIVHALLRSTTFKKDGHSYRYHEGMLGWAEARVRQESLLLTLVPALKALLPHE